MARLLSLLLVLTLGCGGGEELKSGPPLGLAFYGMLSPNAGSIIDKFIEIQKESDHPATAILWASFGKEEKYLAQYFHAMGEREHTVEIHFSNEVGRRNGRLNSDDWHPFAGIDSLNTQLENYNEEIRSEIEARVNEILEFTQKFQGNVTWVLSLGLEDNYTDAATKNLKEIIERVWPYEIAHNPLDGQYIGGVLSESHHYSGVFAKPPRCIIGGDGQDLPTGIDYLGAPRATMQAVRGFIEYGRESGCITLLWSAETQGLDRPFTSTRDRSFRMADKTFVFLKDEIKAARLAYQATH